MPINFPNSPTQNDTYTSDGSSWIWDGTVWNLVSSGITRPLNNSNGFQTIDIVGQNSIVADSPSGTLKLIAGDNIILETDNTTDSITITASTLSAPTINRFTTVSVIGSELITSTSDNDTLVFEAGTGISLSTDSATKTVTITNSVQNIQDFSGTVDATRSGTTIDRIYLPAITSLTVTNSGSSSFLFDQYSGGNPTLYAISGTTIAFNLDVVGHPFLIQDVAGDPYSTGLVHVSTNGTVSTGTDAQGKETGTLYWKLPQSISGTYRYQCQIHGTMVGTITVKQIASF